MSTREQDEDDAGERPEAENVRKEASRRDWYPIGLPDHIFRRLMDGLDVGQVGEAIRRIREYEQLSLEEAASHACIAPSYLWRIEHGERQPRWLTVVKLGLASLSLSVPQTNTLISLAGFGAL